MKSGSLWPTYAAGTHSEIAPGVHILLPFPQEEGEEK